jgi:hypothetical protein
LKSSRVDAAGRGEPPDELVRPVAVGIQLEPQVRIQLEPALDVRDSRRDDEAHRPYLTAERITERVTRLAQSEVERGRLERPAPVVRLAGLEERVGVERVPAHERELALPRLELLVHARVVVDVLAAPLVAAAAEHDDRSAERETACDLARERLELVFLDLERERADLVVAAHAPRRRWR